MIVKDVMRKDVKTISPGGNVRDAAEEMRKLDLGCLVIVKSERLVGILTEWDILVKLVCKDLEASKTLVKDIMTTDLVVVDEDMEIEDAVELMVEKKIKKLPVVSKDRLVGIVTAADLCAVQPRLIRSLASLMLMPRSKKVVAG